MSSPVHIYSAKRRELRVRGVIREMIKGLIESRYIGYRLAYRDIKAQYSQSALGMFWDFMDPLVLAFIFHMLREGNVFSTGETPMPYSVYTTYGLFMYATFVSSVMLSVNVMVNARNLLRQQKFHPEALLISIFYRVCFMSVFRIVVMLIFSFATGAFVLVGMLKFILLFPVLILAGMAIGVFLAPFNVVYRDVGRFASMILVPLRFISPVLFVLPDTPLYNTITYCNPFAIILMNLRLLATTNTMTDLLPLAIHLVILVAVGLVGWFIYHVSVPVLTDRA